MFTRTCAEDRETQMDVTGSDSGSANTCRETHGLLPGELEEQFASQPFLSGVYVETMMANLWEKDNCVAHSSEATRKLFEALSARGGDLLQGGEVHDLDVAVRVHDLSRGDREGRNR